MKKHFLKSILVLCVVLFSSSQIFSQWAAQTSGTTVTLRGVRAVNDNVVWACGASGVVLKTINGGTTWRVLTPTLATATNYMVDAFDTTTAWVTGTVGGTANFYIWKTTDGGTTWVQQYNNVNGFGDGIRFFDSNNGFCWADPDPFPSGNWELLTTTNGGTNWNRVPRTNFPQADSVFEEFGAAGGLENVGNTLWFTSYYNQTSTNQARIYKSTNRGLNWTATGIPFPAPTAMYPAFKDLNNGVVVSLNGDVGRTVDGGANWIVSSIPSTVLRYVTYAPLVNSYITVGSSGVSFYSLDNGANWNPLTTGVTSILRAVDAATNSAWAVGNSGVILKLNIVILPVELTSFVASIVDKNVILNWTTATEINNRGFEVQRKSVTGDFVSVAFVEGHGTTQEIQSYSYTDRNIESGKYSYRLKQIDFNGAYSYSNVVEVDARIPAKFGLNQNYPNPFNPTTTISYEIAKETLVSLKVYDAIGNEIATLVNETKAPGTYEVVFNASGLSNGVYLYKIQAGNFTATKKLILMK